MLWWLALAGLSSKGEDTEDVPQEVHSLHTRNSRQRVASRRDMGQSAKLEDEALQCSHRRREIETSKHQAVMPWASIGHTAVVRVLQVA